MCGHQVWNGEADDNIKVVVNETALEQKAGACRMICKFVRDLGTAFIPHIEEVINHIKFIN